MGTKKFTKGTIFLRIGILTSFFFHRTKEYDGDDRIIWGGAERYLHELCRLLQEQGHQVTVYQPLPMNNPQVKSYASIEKEYRGIRVICIPTKDKWEYSTAPGLNYAFNELSIYYDLRIYFVTFMAWPEIRRPAITISHGIYWDSPSHNIRNMNHEQRAEFWRRHLYGFTAPDACVAVDTNVRNVVAALEPGAENRVHVIPNFVNTETFKPLPAEQRTWDRPRVLFPRRLSTLRGVNDFIKMTASFPDVDFYVCGNATDPNMEAQLKQWSEGRDNIKTIWRPMERMEEVYQAADIAIIPTRGAEGTSLSCLEAMATGLPVITTPVGGLPNLIIDGWNGYVVDLNHGELAPAVAKLLKSPRIAARFGRRNRQMAVEAFDLKIWRRKWMEVIKKVV